MYYTKNNIKITARKYTDDAGTQYPNPQWFDGATDEQLSSLGIIRHDEAIKPDYNQSTQRLIILDSGEYGIVDLTQAELDDRKVQSVSMRQARLALLQQNLLPQINTAIEALPSPAHEAAMVEWEYAATIRRDSQLVQSLASALQLNDNDLDAIFELASTL